MRYGLSFDPGSKEYFSVDSKSGNITLVEKLDREVNFTKMYRSTIQCFYNNLVAVLTYYYYLLRNKTLLMFLSASLMGKARYQLLAPFKKKSQNTKLQHALWFYPTVGSCF